MRRPVSQRRYSLLLRLGVLWASCFSIAAAGEAFSRVAYGDVTPAESSPADARQLYNLGKDALRAGQLGEAASRLQRAIEKAALEKLPVEEQALMYYVLGLAQQRASHEVAAAAAFRRSLELNPVDAECRLELAQLLLRTQHPAAAKHEAEAALRSGLSEEADRAAAQSLVLEASARGLFAEGRELLKARQSEAAASKLKEAASKAREAALSKDEQTLYLYLLGLALDRANHNAESLAAYREALRLSPRDAEVRLALAQALLSGESFDEARAEAEQSLRNGLGDADDKKEAAGLIQQAKREALHQRFFADVSIAYSYDSNVLQGRYETIAGVYRNQDKSKGILANSQEFLDMYHVPIQPRSEYDFPLTVNLSLGGRLAGKKLIELWTGFRAYSYTMTIPGFYKPLLENCDSAVDMPCPPYHNVYNMLEFTVPLWLNINPMNRLSLEVRTEGFVNFAGQSGGLGIEPFQGGFLGAAKLVFVESVRWRTRLSYEHQLRRSFTTEDNYLSGDRDDVRLSQELRLLGAKTQLRATLGYRFRSELAEQYTINLLTYEINSRELKFDYIAPLTYIGNEIALRLRYMIPWKIELGTKIGYENRSYYKAAYRLAKCTMGLVRINCTQQLPSLDLDLSFTSVYRIDHVTSFDLYINKSFAPGFSFELGYSGLFNFSNIQNAIDNRNYTKHTVTLTAAYSF